MATDPHADVAPYALDALDADEERAFEEHLASCEACREELASLREATAALAYGAVGPAPPPELKQRILARREGRAPERRLAATAPLVDGAARRRGCGCRGRRDRRRRLGGHPPGRERRLHVRAGEARREAHADGRSGHAGGRARRHGRDRAHGPARARGQDLRGLGDPRRSGEARRALLRRRPCCGSNGPSSPARSSPSRSSAPAASTSRRASRSPPARRSRDRADGAAAARAPVA